MDGLSPNQLEGVHMNDVPIVEVLLTLNILHYALAAASENSLDEVCRNTTTIRLLIHINHTCYVSKINAVFQSFRSPNFDTFFSRIFNLEPHLTTCSKRVKNIYPRNVYQNRETLFDKLDSLGIKYTSQQKLFKNLATPDFESICVQEESSRDTKTTTWIGKNAPISVSISSNLVEEPIFFYNSEPHYLVLSFISTGGCGVPK